MCECVRFLLLLIIIVHLVLLVNCGLYRVAQKTSRNLCNYMAHILHGAPLVTQISGRFFGPPSMCCFCANRSSPVILSSV